MFSAAASPPRTLTLVLLTALSVLSLNMFLPSLPKMAVEFQAGYGLVNLSIAGYLAVTAVLQLVMGPLSDRYGRRPVMLAALILFIAASLGCALTDNIWSFLGFRVLQGAVIAGGVLSRAAIRDMKPPQEAASLMGTVAMAMAVAPMLGPLFGGVIDQLLGWRASFHTFTVLGATVLLLTWVDMGETNVSRSETFLNQFRAYPDLLRSGRFWGYALCMAFSTAAFYVFLSGVPLVAGPVLDLPPASLGFFMGTITAGFFLGSFLSRRYAGHHALTTMMIAGRLAACAGLLAGMALFLFGLVNPLTLFGATVFVGIGNGLTMPSSNAGAMSVRPDLVGSAAGLSGALIVAAGAVFTAFTGAVLTEQMGVYGLTGMMLLCSAAGLVSALAVLWLDRRPEPA